MINIEQTTKNLRKWMDDHYARLARKRYEESKEAWEEAKKSEFRWFPDFERRKVFVYHKGELVGEALLTKERKEALAAEWACICAMFQEAHYRVDEWPKRMEDLPQFKFMREYEALFDDRD